MKDQIKELRVKIDGLAQLTKELKVLLGYSFDKTEVYGNTKEIEKATDSLYLAKAWLGKVLGELGNENPYQVKIEVTQEWIEDYEGSGKWNSYVGWETDNEINIIDKNIIVTDTDKHGHPIKGYYIAGYKTKEDIVPTQDVAGIDDMLEGGKPAYDYYNMNHIEKVDWLRTEIQKLIDDSPNFSEKHDYIELEQGFVYKCLCEAKFWLGFELGRVKTA